MGWNFLRRGTKCASCEALRAESADVKKQLAQALKRIEELESRLRKNSSNSSRPPSSDPPWKKAEKAPPSGRKPGGQPGHEGHHRELLSETEMDEVVTVKPTSCLDCGGGLSGDDPNPHRHQVVEIPKPKAHWMEYVIHTLVCGNCGKRTTAEWPKGVPKGNFGPRLQGLIATCSGVYFLSKRTIVEMLGDWWGIPISLGSVSASEKAVSEALSGPMAEAVASVQKAHTANVDETGWRERWKRAWLWVMVTPWVTVFLVHARRNAEAAQALCGSFKGHLMSDRWRVYLAWPVRKRQLCWAHLLREFKAFSEMRGSAGRIGKKLRVEADQMFQWWKRVRDGTMSRSTFRQYLCPLRRRTRHLLEEGARTRNRDLSATCRDLLKLYPALWTFAQVEGVKPTNNAAERAIRKGVLWRKGSFGTHSAAGSRFAERMLTVAATLRLQNRNIVEFVTEACEASLVGRKAPSLLPSRRVLTLLKAG